MKKENYWQRKNIEVKTMKISLYHQILILIVVEYDEETPYLFLSVDLPPPPLFRDEFKESIIPQVPLFQILTKFDGQTAQEYKTYKDNFLKRYEITKLPPYLILCFRVSLFQEHQILYSFLCFSVSRRIHSIWKKIQLLSIFLSSM
jgi:hypothetical protein